MTKLENDAKYDGEWLSQTQIRQGKGVLIWPDGSIYEGYWVDNKANGKGRLVHADGEFYDGYWKADKVHGHCTYLHSDGAKYSGDWFEDN